MKHTAAEIFGITPWGGEAHDVLMTECDGLQARSEIVLRQLDRLLSGNDHTVESSNCSPPSITELEADTCRRPRNLHLDWLLADNL
jgi:hypothetical protein